MATVHGFMIDSNDPSPDSADTHTCRECGEHAFTVPEIDHGNNCSAITELLYTPERLASTPPPHSFVKREPDPTDVDLPFADETILLLMKIVRETTWMVEFDDREMTDIYDRIEGIDGVQRTIRRTSPRVIVDIGRTTPKGTFHVPDGRGLIVKVDPTLRFVDVPSMHKFDMDRTNSQSNLSELSTYETAVDLGTEELFAEIFAAAPDGMWHVMERCVPVVDTVEEARKSRVETVADPDGTNYFEPYQRKYFEAGWRFGDCTSGNIGIADDGRCVFIDYAGRSTHTSQHKE